MNTADFSRYTDALSKTLNNEILIKLVLYRKIVESYDGNEHIPTSSSNFFKQIIGSALRSEIIVVLYDFVGPRNLNDRRINRFLNHIENNLTKIEWHSRPCQNDIKRDRQLLVKIEPIIIRLIECRNKYFAHRDEEHFYEPEVTLVDLMPTCDELDLIVRTLKKIVGFYKLAGTGSGSIFLYDPISHEFDQFLKRL